MVVLWALFGTGRVSKRGAEVLRIAFLAVIGDGGVTMAGDKAPLNLGYGASHGIGLTVP